MCKDYCNRCTPWKPPTKSSFRDYIQENMVAITNHIETSVKSCSVLLVFNVCLVWHLRCGDMNYLAGRWLVINSEYPDFLHYIISLLYIVCEIIFKLFIPLAVLLSVCYCWKELSVTDTSYLSSDGIFQ